MNEKNNSVVMFACNQGGHFSQMMALSDLFGKYESVLVTDNIRATKEMRELNDIDTIEYAMAMAEKRKKLSKDGKDGDSRCSFITAYIRLYFECRKLVKKYRPVVIISTGSNIAVPLFVIGKMRGCKLIFIETRAKVYSKSLTGKLIGRLANQIFVQWPEMLKLYSNAKYCGTLV